VDESRNLGIFTGLRLFRELGIGLPDPHIGLKSAQARLLVLLDQPAVNGMPKMRAAVFMSTSSVCSASFGGPGRFCIS